MNARYRVALSDAQRRELEALLAGGEAKVREIKRAQILLAAARGATEAMIVAALGVSTATIYRTKRAFVEEGLAAALHDAPRPGGRRKLSAKDEALLIATACSAPPEGRARWTVRLLAGRMIELATHATLSDETVRRRLHDNALKPWLQKMWCVPTVNSTYVARMEDVLDLYAAPPNPARPVLCFDESPVGLIGDARAPEPVAPGQPARVDYEYVRHGSTTLFVMLDVHRGWRHVVVSPRRTSYEFAHQIQALVDEHYPEAECLRIVLDNLSTHTAAALYDTFPPAEARRLLRKVEFHYTPAHASWLNMVEIEIGVLKKQCLARRLADVATLEREIAAWEHARNVAGARIHWLFTTEHARAKLGRVYRPLDVARKKAADEARKAAA